VTVRGMLLRHKNGNNVITILYNFFFDK